MVNVIGLGYIGLPTVLMMIFMPESNTNEQGQFLQSGYINIAYFTSLLCLICGIICVLGSLRSVQEIYSDKSDVKVKKTFIQTLNAFFKIFYTFPKITKTFKFP